LGYKEYKEKYGAWLCFQYALREVAAYIQEGQYEKVTMNDLVTLCDGSKDQAQYLRTLMRKSELIDKNGNVNRTNVGYFLKAMKDIERSL